MLSSHKLLVKKDMKDFKKLQVWQESVSLVTKLHIELKALPQSERYGLYSQMTRAAVSIPSNIAEGSGRRSDKDYRRFLDIALGSSFELETQFIIVENLNYIEEDRIQLLLDKLTKIQKMLQGLIKAVSH